MGRSKSIPAGKSFTCRLREVRQEAGYTQDELADLVGLKRQAIYDIERGKYMPNTLVAMKLSSLLGCRVEDLFSLETYTDSAGSALLLGGMESGARVRLFKVGSKIICHPADSLEAMARAFSLADGVIGPSGEVKLLSGNPVAADRALLAGCDPAFGVLASLCGGLPGKGSLSCQFASSGSSLSLVSRGMVHLAGVHYHGTGESDNPGKARISMAGARATVFGFAHFEEGFMVAPGNPRRISGIADLTAPGVRMVNREDGAAIRSLLDNLLIENGVYSHQISGYESMVSGHFEGAAEVAWGRVDVALGLRAVARAFGLDFVPLAQVRCDIVVPDAVMGHPGVLKTLDVLQTGALREQVAALAGYETRDTGRVIARF